MQVQRLLGEESHCWSGPKENRKTEKDQKRPFVRFCCSVGTDIDLAPAIYFQPFSAKLNGNNNLILRKDFEFESKIKS